MIKFSIVIPVYNVAPYLKACLESVVANKPYEIVCVDDGSTDGSALILDDLAEAHSCIKVVHQSNRGVSAARNYGLSMISGEWFGFVDADDLVEPVWLKLVEKRILQQPELEMISFGQDTFDEQGTIGEPRPALDCFNTGFCQTVYKTSSLGGIRFPYFKQAEDRVYTFRCLVQSTNRFFGSDIVYHYRKRTTSAMNTKPNFRRRWQSFLAGVLMVLLLPRIKGSTMRVFLQYGWEVVWKIKYLIIGA